MTFRCSNGIRQGGQLSPLLYNVYTDYLNYHLQATGVGCYVGGAWLNSLSYVLMTLIVQHNENVIYAGPAKAIAGSVLNKSQALK